MERLYLSLVLVFGAFLLSCGAKGEACKPNPSPFPRSRMATFVESYSTNEFLIRATGKGCNVDEAIEDAKKVAVWFVLFGGDKPLLKTPEERSKFSKVSNQIFSNPDEFIRWQSDVLEKKREGKYTLITYNFRIDVGALKERLISEGIIKSTEELAEELGLPTVAVLSKQRDELSRFAITTLQEYLQDNNFEVYVAEQAKRTNSLIKKVVAFEGNPDPLYALALQLGSDIYVETRVRLSRRVVGGVEVKKASVIAKAYETATGKLLGSSTGYSPERDVSDYAPLVEEATHDVASKILSQIKRSWIREVKRGKPFKVVVFTSANQRRRVERSIYRILKKLSKRPVKRVAVGRTVMSFIAYIKGVDNAYDLFTQIEEMYRGPGKVEKVLDAGSFLVIKAGSGSVEIEVE